MRHTHLSLLALLALAACGDGTTNDSASSSSAAATTEETSDRSLTPQGYGDMRIGMSANDLTALVGTSPNAQNTGDPEACMYFHPDQAPAGVLVMVEAGTLTRISLTDGADISSDRGIHVGDAAAKVKAAYGDTLLESPHKYVEAPAAYLTVWADGREAPYVSAPEARGIRYEIGADGKVTAIHAGGPAIQYVEGCS
ncbi:hypothetical protein [Parvularcula sp. LCG005]|uniref:hypothetical protein n=1 Tax=Parvularcula sp. LCG005 TaxID=3078805 RepID=UPI002943DD63|nr:hypothetical protein [Parvularcula sp. LCG005]WOI53723.1 hypothetical protein RUI03_01695 [Parvularcula sp. LCG005]